jgi:diguanylate cyclase (GGDEF)-like protein
LVQVSHRFLGDRLKLSGRADKNTLAHFHASLLEVLPHAAAYVAEDGDILVHNAHMQRECAASGLADVPENLKDLLSESSWKRCEPVLSAAFGGVPVRASGTMLLQSGAPFCRHVICTSFVSLAGARQAVLVQFDPAEGGDPAVGGTPDKVARVAAGARLAGRDLIAHFPDDIVFFEGGESAGERAALLMAAIGSDHEPGELREALEAVEPGMPDRLYVPEVPGFEPADHAGERRMCEIRIVPIPEAGTRTPPGPAHRGAAHSGAAHSGAAMAIIRRNVDCPREVAANRRLAYLDPLTGLGNRRAFTRALKRALGRPASDAASGLAVFYIDLDEFKKVNDLGGHDAGDDMLLRVAACLRQTLGEAGTAARIGGDEFAGMVPVAGKDAALDVAGRILDGFERIRLELGNRVFTIGGSIGVAYVDGSLAPGDADAAVILGLADRACLRGKRVGGRSVQIHSVETSDCRSVEYEGAELPEPGSFRASELTLYAMPIVCLERNRVCGSEILLRLQGDRATGLSSRAWISAAERSGFIARVDAWTLDKVLDAAGRNPERSILTMNVSAESARDPDFRDALRQRLSADPLLASRLCLEIAERDFLREPSSVETFFNFVADLGCQTAIDDFAGHWPVLSRLTGLRVAWLKLEAGLTQQVVETPAKAAILNGLVRAAHELGIKVIAKHVETREEADLLRGLDIEAAQGFYFGRPQPWSGG